MSNLQNIGVLLFLALVISTSSSPIKQERAERRPFEFEDVIPNQFYLSGFNGTWITENEFIFRNSNGDLILYDAGTSNQRIFVNSSVFTALSASSYTLSPDRAQLLIRYDVKSIYRHSTIAKYVVHEIESGQNHHIADQEHISICLWSPVGVTLAYVKDNDVYYRNASGNEIRLTFDGEPGVIYNGVPDWVYEEEVFGTDGALWFSPNGNRIAIASFNDTEVEEFTYFMYGEPGSLDYQYPEHITLRYPKPGTNNPVVRLRVIDLTDTQYEWNDIEAPISVVSPDHILGTVFWYNNDDVGAIWLNRRQNVSTLEKCNATSLQCEQLLLTVLPQGWVELNTPKCVNDRCYFIGDVNNWDNVIAINTVAKELHNVTSRAFTVQNIYGIHPVSGDVYYMGTSESDPTHRHVYRNNDCLSCQLLSPEGNKCTYASASFSKDFSYYALTCTGPDPTFVGLYRGQNVYYQAPWNVNQNTRTKLLEFQEPQKLMLRVPVEGGFQAVVKCLLPPEIDMNSSNFTQKYPMIVYVYGGPNSVQVTDSFGITFEHYLITNKKIIYCRIDGRGSGNKGNEMLFTINNQLGTVEIQDQTAVAKYLQDTYQFIDPTHTAIWGWSYGGYATAMALAQDKEKVFKCGMSVAPVTSWIYYDTIYTERYMGLPTEEDNLQGYDNADVTRRIEEMRNHHFLLIHGNADDNVHFQQAMALSRALQNASILFEQMSYPDEAHGLTGVSRHLYHTMDEFWKQCFHLYNEDDD